MSTASSEVEQLEDHEELESNPDGSPAMACGPSQPGDMSMIARSWDTAMRELLHSVPRLARDVKGAPLLSQHINSMDSQGLALLVAALRPQLPELACDAAGAGVVQQIFRSCSETPALRFQLIQSLQGCIQKLTKALESATWEMQMPIMTELKGKVFYCSRHMHGNFVMQKVIQTLPPNALGFMITELKENAVAAALHIYACRVLQRLIECCGVATSDLVDILLQPGEQLQRLVKDPYSSNVIRSLVVCGNVSQVQIVMRLFSTDVMKFSRNRHASLVLEKCLEVSAFGVKAASLTQERRELMNAFFSTSRSASPPLLQIMLDRIRSRPGDVRPRRLRGTGGSARPIRSGARVLHSEERRARFPCRGVEAPVGSHRRFVVLAR
ncbi:unnamed protein product [Durusdinium trenchii]|uniref:Pumilio homolog 5 (APUM-5) (AtPUM5) n=2 Tax=Durusdinium trenchii TaxID=1381693 RepID=A0ABP0PVK5_9DINO